MVNLTKSASSQRDNCGTIRKVHTLSKVQIEYPSALPLPSRDVDLIVVHFNIFRSQLGFGENSFASHLSLPLPFSPSLIQELQSLSVRLLLLNAKVDETKDVPEKGGERLDEQQSVLEAKHDDHVGSGLAKDGIHAVAKHRHVV